MSNTVYILSECTIHEKVLMFNFRSNKIVMRVFDMGKGFGRKNMLKCKYYNPKRFYKIIMLAFDMIKTSMYRI